MQQESSQLINESFKQAVYLQNSNQLQAWEQVSSKRTAVNWSSKQTSNRPTLQSEQASKPKKQANKPDTKTEATEDQDQPVSKEASKTWAIKSSGPRPNYILGGRHLYNVLIVTFGQLFTTFVYWEFVCKVQSYCQLEFGGSY